MTENNEDGDKSWADNFKNVKQDDGPRDSSHGKVQNTTIQFGKGVTRMKSKLSNDFEMMKYKMEVEAPIITNLSMETKQDIEKARVSLVSMIERKTKGPLRELFRNHEVYVHYLKHMKPKEWNNIPIPVQEMSEHLINFDRNSLQIA